MSDLPLELARLAHLDRARNEAKVYFAPLLEDDNLLVRVGAWCESIDRDAIAPAQFEQVLTLSATSAAVRSRAFRYFEKLFEHQLAADAVATAPPSESQAETAAMQAELNDDADGAEAAARAAFIAKGKFEQLLDLSEKAERAGGWRRALDVAIAMILLFPHEPIGLNRLLAILYQVRRTDLLDAALRPLDRNGLHPYLCTLYRAALQLLSGDARACLSALGRLPTVRQTRPDVLERVRPMVGTLAAEAHERLGDYRRAFALYAERNAPRPDKARFDLEELPRITLAAAARPVPQLPIDPRTNFLIMTGFPRSGTTLLENALAAHDQIETFEEIPSRESVEKHMRRAGAEKLGSADLYLAAREYYYDEIERRRHKPGARVFLDKMPMRSVEAGFMSKLFPEKRYIFSIRHPYDVVLSCFKQDFGRNIAMEHFRTIDGAARLYNFAMTQWFGVYGLDDPRVHYLRYDDLVTSFEASMRGVLAFVGVDWSGDVLDFAEAAGRRAAKTPSYQKVRQGLSLGLQTQWENYRFAFESEATQALGKWVRFFGYATD